MTTPQASVVIGFKDWGLDRLERCVRSILTSFEDVPVEVITSDYGSADGAAVERACRNSGARYLRTDTDGTWSRSRALNAGLAVAGGEFLYTADADMLFTPGALRRVHRRLESIPCEAVILQCRDLPAGTGEDNGSEPDWAALEMVSTVRPRWGMGGLVGVAASALDRVRGYDERMHTYGGEDIDFGKRLRRSGVPINWLDLPETRMYHVWHPSTSAASTRSIEATLAIQNNRQLHTEDQTAARNRLHWRHARPQAAPVVSVVAEARDGALNEYASVLDQSVTDLELVLAGDQEVAHRLVAALDDPRVRVVTVGEKPWWRALDSVRAEHALLHGPSTWHTPNRIERLLDAVTAGDRAVADSCGLVRWDEDGSLSAHGGHTRSMAPEAWASVLMPTPHVHAVLPTIPDGAEDPHEVTFALLRNGVSMGLIEELGRGRTVAADADGEVRLDRALAESASLSRRLTLAGVQVSWPQAGDLELDEAAVAIVESQLRDRIDLLFTVATQDGLDRLHEIVDGDDGALRIGWRAEEDGLALVHFVEVIGLSRSRARRAQATLEHLKALLAVDELGPLRTPRNQDLVDRLLAVYDGLYGTAGRSSWVVVSADTPETVQRAVTLLSDSSGVPVVLARDIVGQDDTVMHVVLAQTATRQATFEVAARLRCSLPAAEGVTAVFGGSGPGDRLSQLVGDAVS